MNADGKAAFVTTISGNIMGPTIGAGPGLSGIGAIADWQVSMSNVNDPNQLKSPGSNVSAAVASGPGLGVDLSMGAGNTVTATLTLGFGKGGFGAGGTFESTAVVQFAINDCEK